MASGRTIGLSAQLIAIAPALLHAISEAQKVSSPNGNSNNNAVGG